MAATNKAIKILIVLGSGREGRLGERVVKFVKSKLENKGVETSFIDPITLGLPVVNQPLHFYQDQSKIPSVLHKFHDIIKDVDGYLLVSAEYNGTICPGLTNCLNYFPPPSFAHKPFAITTYSMGAFGGVVAGSHLRQHVSMLNGAVLPGSLVIPNVGSALDEEGKANERVEKNGGKLIDTLIWYTEALLNQKTVKGLPPI